MDHTESFYWLNQKQKATINPNNNNDDKLITAITAVFEKSFTLRKQINSTCGLTEIRSYEDFTFWY